MRWLIFCALWLPLQQLDAAPLIDGRPVAADRVTYRWQQTASEPDPETPGSQWLPAPAGGEISFGYARKPLWLRLDFSRPADTRWLLEVGNPRIDRIDLWLYHQGRLLTRQRAGALLPWSALPRPHAHPLFPLDLVEPGEYQLLLPMRFWREQSFQRQDARRQMGLGVFFGAMFMLVFLSLAMAVSSRDRDSLRLTLFLISIGLVLAALDGFSRNSLWPDQPQWVKRQLPLFEGLAVWFALACTRDFFRDRPTPRPLVWLGRFSAHGGLLAALLSVTSVYGEAILLMTLCGPLAALVVLLTSMHHGWQGFAPARSYLAAWLLLSLATFFYGLSSGGLLPFAASASWGLHLGVLLTGLMLLHGFGQRVNRLFQEKNRAQEALIAQQQQQLQWQAATMQAIDRFVPRPLLAQLGCQDLTQVEQGLARATRLTILFADIRSFSRISEDADAAGVFHLLNEYLSLMEPLIEKHGGFVDKYIGDAIMAVFAQRPEQALAAATDMMRTLARYNLSRRTAGTEPVRIGIGIHHGPVILGTVGSRHRIETTAIGDTVNISARLESLSKTLGEPVLVSASVLRGLTDRQAFSFRYMDAVVLPGKSRPVEVYALQLQPDAHPDASPVAGATPTKEQDGKANSRETAE